MHNCIIQLDTTPFDHEDNLITSDDFNDDWFIGEIADYVRDYDDKEKMMRSIGYVMTQPGLDYDKAKGTVTVRSKEAYFLDKYKKFIEVIRQASQWSLDDFISKVRWDMTEIKSLYDDKFGTYIADSYHGLTTLDNFIRDCDNGDVFYIGNALDYHF